MKIRLLFLLFIILQSYENLYAQLPNSSEWVVDYVDETIDNNSVSFPNNKEIHINANNTSIGLITIPNIDFTNITQAYLTCNYNIQSDNNTALGNFLIGGEEIAAIPNGNDNTLSLDISAYISNQLDQSNVDIAFYFSAENGDIIEINNLDVDVIYTPIFTVNKNTNPENVNIAISESEINVIAMAGTNNDIVTILSNLIDLSNIDNPVLSLDYQTVNALGNSCRNSLLISTNGGASFEETLIVQGNSNENGNTFRLPLTAYDNTNIIIGLQLTDINADFEGDYNLIIASDKNGDNDIVIKSGNTKDGGDAGIDGIYDCLPLNKPIKFEINYEVFAAQCGNGLSNQTSFRTKASVFNSNNVEIWTLTVPYNTYEMAGEKWQVIAGNADCECDADGNINGQDCAFYACEAGTYTLKVAILDDSDCESDNNGVEFTQTLIAGCCEASVGNTVTYNDFSAIPNMVYAEETITIHANNQLSDSKVVLAGESITLTQGAIVPNMTNNEFGTLLDIAHCEEIDNSNGKTNEESYFAIPIGDADFKIYPNPTNTVANIVYNLKNDTKVGISIYNTLGQRVAQIEAYNEKAKGSYKISYDTSNLEAGIYYCTLESANFVKKIKIVKIE